MESDSNIAVGEFRRHLSGYVLRLGRQGIGSVHCPVDRAVCLARVMEVVVAVGEVTREGSARVRAGTCCMESGQRYLLVRDAVIKGRRCRGHGRRNVRVCERRGKEKKNNV